MEDAKDSFLIKFLGFRNNFTKPDKLSRFYSLYGRSSEEIFSLEDFPTGGEIKEERITMGLLFSLFVNLAFITGTGALRNLGLAMSIALLVSQLPGETFKPEVVTFGLFAVQFFYRTSFALGAVKETYVPIWYIPDLLFLDMGAIFISLLIWHSQLKHLYASPRNAIIVGLLVWVATIYPTMLLERWQIGRWKRVVRE